MSALRAMTGEPMLLRTDTQIPTEMFDFGSFRPDELEEVPQAYVLDPDVLPDLSHVIDLLRAHGIDLEILDEPRDVQAVEFFRIDSVDTSAREYQGHFAQEVFGAYDHLDEATLESGSVVIPMDQPLARVAFKLLEPRSDDGLVAWGLLKDSLTPGAPYPILRVMSEPEDPAFSARVSVG